VKVTKTQTSKKEGKESKNADATGERESAKERKKMANFICADEERENRYWMEEEERRCRMYYL
jgi:hypothetical protein